MKLPKCSRRAVEVFQDPQLMYLETDSGVCIDVEGFICTNAAYEISCEIGCENGIARLAQPPATEISTEGYTKHGLETDWAGRFEEAYTTELQEWVNAVLQDRQEGPNAWDGYVASIVATAAQESLKTGEKLMLLTDETPEFYKN